MVAKVKESIFVSLLFQGEVLLARQVDILKLADDGAQQQEASSHERAITKNIEPFSAVHFGPLVGSE